MIRSAYSGKEYARDMAKDCVGPGWAGLIDEIFDILPGDAAVAQVKEKFGGLRFYFYGDMQDEVDAVCDRSVKVCEECGRPGNLREDRPWVKTLCDGCAGEDGR